MSEKKKVLVAMSGGVDSTVAAAVLMQSYHVTGVTMRLFTNDEIDVSEGKTCCSLDDVQDARYAANKLGIEHYVYNFGERFRECVIDRFSNAYINGMTPNPCIDCNRYIKFDTLLKRAEMLGYDYIATGHYVRRGYDEKAGRYILMKGADESKDQSYVLYNLTQEQLSKTLFPIGELTKTKTRETAMKYGFDNASKPDSQDICFVPDGDYAGFIEYYTGIKFPKGNFTDKDGNILGEHSGIIRYTIGQRKGLGIALGKPAYVISKNTVDNTVVLGDNEDLFCDTVYAEDVNWVSIACPDEPLRVEAKIRYNQKAQPAVLYPLSDNKFKLVFDAPQRAVTPGQAAVCYIGDLLICGGAISNQQLAMCNVQLKQEPL